MEPEEVGRSQPQQQQAEVVLDPLDGVVKLQTAEEAAVADNQNSICPERRNCAGFEENIVLGTGQLVF